MIRVGHVRDTDLNYEAVIIEDSASGDDLQIQRSLDFDDQDHALGMATYCLVRGGAAHYGGLVAWRVSGSSFVMELNSEAAEALDLPAMTEIPVDADGAALLAELLPRLVS